MYALYNNPDGYNQRSKRYKMVGPHANTALVEKNIYALILFLRNLIILTSHFNTSYPKKQQPNLLLDPGLLNFPV